MSKPNIDALNRGETVEATQLPAHIERSAREYLDDMRGNVSRESMIANVAIQYGITQQQAEDVVTKWERIE
jgi:hypothetical protein